MKKVFIALAFVVIASTVSVFAATENEDINAFIAAKYCHDDAA